MPSAFRFGRKGKIYLDIVPPESFVGRMLKYPYQLGPQLRENAHGKVYQVTDVLRPTDRYEAQAYQLRGAGRKDYQYRRRNYDRATRKPSFRSSFVFNNLTFVVSRLDEPCSEESASVDCETEVDPDEPLEPRNMRFVEQNPPANEPTKDNQASFQAPNLARKHTKRARTLMYAAIDALILASCDARSWKSDILDCDEAASWAREYLRHFLGNTLEPAILPLCEPCGEHVHLPAFKEKFFSLYFIFRYEESAEPSQMSLVYGVWPDFLLNLDVVRHIMSIPESGWSMHQPCQNVLGAFESLVLLYNTAEKRLHPNTRAWYDWLNHTADTRLIASNIDELNERLLNSRHILMQKQRLRMKLRRHRQHAKRGTQVIDALDY